MMNEICRYHLAGLLVLAAALAVQSAAAQAPGSSLGSPARGPSSMSQNIPAAPLLAPSAPPAKPLVPAGRSSPASTTGVDRRAAKPAMSKSAPLVLLSPRRALLLKQQQLLRAQEDLLAQKAGARLSVIASGGTAEKSAGELLKPGIRNINGKASGAIAKPGGTLTISGRGFGDVPGEVAILGKFPDGKEAQPSLKWTVALLPLQWADGKIVVRVPEGLRGVEDQQIALTVATSTGQFFRQDQARYFALREEIAIPADAFDRVVEILPDKSWMPTLEKQFVNRRQDAPKLVCPKPAADIVRFRPLRPGWDVVGISMEHGRTDSGDGGELGAGSRTFFPAYEFGPWSDQQIQVRWGVWRSHASASVTRSARDACESRYSLSVRAIGPAGLLPFTAQTQSAPTAPSQGAPVPPPQPTPGWSPPLKALAPVPLPPPPDKRLSGAGPSIRALVPQPPASGGVGRGGGGADAP